MPNLIGKSSRPFDELVALTGFDMSDFRDMFS